MVFIIPSPFFLPALGLISVATAAQNTTDCIATPNRYDDGSDGNLYCINGGTTGNYSAYWGDTCTCTACNAGYSGANCETADRCVATTNRSDDGSDGNLYCEGENYYIGGETGACSCYFYNYRRSSSYDDDDDDDDGGFGMFIALGLFFYWFVYTGVVLTCLSCCLGVFRETPEGMEKVCGSDTCCMAFLSCNPFVCLFCPVDLINKQPVQAVGLHADQQSAVEQQPGQVRIWPEDVNGTSIQAAQRMQEGQVFAMIEDAIVQAPPMAPAVMYRVEDPSHDFQPSSIEYSVERGERGEEEGGI